MVASISLQFTGGMNISIMSIEYIAQTTRFLKFLIQSWAPLKFHHYFITTEAW